MAPQSDDIARTETEQNDHPPVSAHNCTAERIVFTEDGNSDGWIATDLTVELRQ